MAEKQKTAEKNVLTSLAMRMHSIMKTVSYIQKDTRVDGKYNAVSHDAVVKKIRPAMVANGVIVTASVMQDEIVREWKSKNGGSWYMTRAKVAVTFHNVDDACDVLTVAAVGYGADNSDKGIGKAVSYAVKYALLKSLSLETGDDADTCDGVQVGEQKSDAKPKNEKFLESMRDLYAKLNDAEAFDAALETCGETRDSMKGITTKPKQVKAYKAVQAAIAVAGKTDNDSF